MSTEKSARLSFPWIEVNIPPALTGANWNHSTFKFQFCFSLYMLPKLSQTEDTYLPAPALSCLYLWLSFLALMMLINYPLLSSQIPSIQLTLSRWVQNAAPEEKEIYCIASKYQWILLIPQRAKKSLLKKSKHGSAALCIKGRGKGNISNWKLKQEARY